MISLQSYEPGALRVPLKSPVRENRTPGSVRGRPGNRAFLPRYSSWMARWLNRDPIGEDGGVNLYGMAENNTINLCDYLGHVAVDFSYDENPAQVPVLNRRIPPWNTQGLTRVSKAQVSCWCDCSNTVSCKVTIKFEIALNSANKKVADNPGPTRNHEMKHVMSLTARIKQSVVDKLKSSKPPATSNYEDCSKNAGKLEEYGNSLFPLRNGFPSGFDDHDLSNNRWAPSRTEEPLNPPSDEVIFDWNNEMRR
jgi:hypothetical protein